MQPNSSRILYLLQMNIFGPVELASLSYTKFTCTSLYESKDTLNSPKMPPFMESRDSGAPLCDLNESRNSSPLKSVMVFNDEAENRDNEDEVHGLLMMNP